MQFEVDCAGSHANCFATLRLLADSTIVAQTQSEDNVQPIGALDGGGR